MQESLNPYQPVASVADAEIIPFFSGPLEWAGHCFIIRVEQMPLSLWLVARLAVTIDENQVERFIKWRWNKRARWTFQHNEKPCNATIQCSGANPIRCRLSVEGFVVGESIVPAKGFWLGLLSVIVITIGIMAIVQYLLRSLTQ